MRYLREENSRIVLGGVLSSDTWLNEPLLPLAKADTPQAIAERKRTVLIADFRKFASECQIIDVKVTEIGGIGWKSGKTTAGYIVCKQQEICRRLSVRKDSLLAENKG